MCAVEAYADASGSLELVIQACAVGPQIMMVAAGRASTQEQLDEGELRADTDVIRCQLCPDRIKRCEPGEQVGVLGSRDDAGQCLVEVMVRVDEAGQHDHM